MERVEADTKEGASCLLYASDAADELRRTGLGGFGRINRGDEANDSADR